MKKVWIYKRAGVRGWWVGWYESGKRKAKSLPTKELAEHFKQIKYTQLNSDVFTGIVVADWQQMIAEYREAKKVQGVTEGTLYEIALSLRNFERLVGKCNSKQITQSAIDKFILQRGTEVSRPTLNKDIRNLKTFINWCRSNIRRGNMPGQQRQPLSGGQNRSKWLSIKYFPPPPKKKNKKGRIIEIFS